MLMASGRCSRSAQCYCLKAEYCCVLFCFFPPFLAIYRPATVRERVLFGVYLKKMQKCFAGENRKGLSEEVLKT